MSIDIKALGNEEKAALVCLYFAHLKGDDPAYKGYLAVLEKVASKYGFKKNTLKNNKDDFDAKFDNGRAGWQHKPLGVRNKFLLEIYEKYKDTPFTDLKRIALAIISEARKEDRHYFSIKTKNAETVNAILSKESNIEFGGLNVLQDSLKLGQLIFIVLGGDKPTWNTGLIGIGVLSKEPYDNGYSGKAKDYKVQVDIKLILNIPIKREDLVPYSDTYGIIGIAPITKWEPNQALTQMPEDKAIALMRAMLEIQPDIDTDLTSLVDENTMRRIKGSSTRFIPVEVNYQEDIAQGIRELKENVTEDGLADQEDDGSEYTKKDFLDEVYISESEYDTLCGILDNKKNIILQGAPGVGKTFIAKRLAYSIIGRKSKRLTNMVQFHQSYSFEDFVVGFRPTETGFALTDGPFYKFCERARKDSEELFFFIIDEINRGNLSKIFGELLMLIEADKREERVLLLYKNEPFNVPKNVHIIGMMNTADRSLALMDYALRRRFSFFNIKPAFESIGFKSRIAPYSENTHIDKVISVIKQLNEEIESDDTLGSGFMIGHSHFCCEKPLTDPIIRNIVEYDIIPLLSEYWFDEPSLVEQWSEKLRGALI